MESLQVEVKIELGHTASCRKKATNEGFTHDWLVFVRGPANCDISHFVEKVVFNLHESFAKPKRVLKEPPYQVGESGYGSFFLPIEVYFKNKDEPRKVVYSYDLFLPVMGSPPIDNIRSEALTFKNPTEEFKRKLLRGGGVVTSVGSHNGFHSTLSPANSQGGSVDTKEGKSTLTYLPGGHNHAQPLPSVQEADKTRNKLVGNKTVKTQESIVSGVKRPVGTPAEDVQTQPAKKKKKKPDEGTPKSNKTVGFIPLDLPTPGSELKEKLAEVKDIKLKIKSLSSKPVSNKKEKKVSSSDMGSSTGLANSTKRRDSSSSTKKVKQKEESKQTKLEDKKLEKITFRRGSGDSWSSSTSSSSLAGHSSGKNPALNALLAEIENGDEDDDEEDDDDGEVDIFTPFQSSSLHSGSLSKHVTDNLKSTNGTVHKKDNNSSGNSQLHKGKSKGSGKKVDTPSNGKKNGLKSPSTESSVMTSPPSKHSPKPRLKDSKQGSNGQQIPSKELVRLYKRLVALKDTTLLQEIVDILETTGQFVVTDTTLDFDLCSLDKTTIKRIESSIGR